MLLFPNEGEVFCMCVLSGRRIRVCVPLSRLDTAGASAEGEDPINFLFVSVVVFFLGKAVIVENTRRLLGAFCITLFLFWLTLLDVPVFIGARITRMRFRGRPRLSCRSI